MNAGDLQAMTDDELRAYIRDREARLAEWRAAGVAADYHAVIAQIKATAAREQQQKQAEEDARAQAINVMRRVQKDMAERFRRMAEDYAKHQPKKTRAKRQAAQEREVEEENLYGVYCPSEEEIEQRCHELRIRKAEQGETPLCYERAGNIAEAYDISYRSSWLPLGSGQWQKAIHNGNTR